MTLRMDRTPRPTHRRRLTIEELEERDAYLPLHQTSLIQHLAARAANDYRIATYLFGALNHAWRLPADPFAPAAQRALREHIARDLAAAYANADLDLYKLDAADLDTFREDVLDIAVHLDRATGHMMDGYRPRCRRPA